MTQPIPPALDGLRIPASFAAWATLVKNADGSLRVGAFEPFQDHYQIPSSFTAIICDGGVHHYFHFIEALIWLFALHREFLPDSRLVRIVFAMPWDNPQQNHVQRSVLAAIYPHVELVDPGWEWPKTYGDVLLIDRSWRDTKINKYLEASLSFARPWALELGQMAREAVRAGVPRGDVPRILHVKRFPPRCLTPTAEAVLLRELSRHGPVTECDFADIPWEQQVRMVATHDVLVGVHGNGLTNAVWMRPGSLVLELFPPGVRHYDYQIYAELCGLMYYGFERDRIFPAFSRTGEPYGHQGPTQQPVREVPEASIAHLLGLFEVRRA